VDDPTSIATMPADIEGPKSSSAPSSFSPPRETSRTGFDGDDRILGHGRRARSAGRPKHGPHRARMSAWHAAAGCELTLYER